MLVVSVLFIAVAAYFLSGATHLLKTVALFPRVESKFEPGRAFTQTGGIRFGQSYWFAGNATVPFAQLRVSQEELVIIISVFGLWRRTFTFPRASVHRLRWQRKLFSVGLQIEHGLAEPPPFILFWVTDRAALAEGLREFGYSASLLKVSFPRFFVFQRVCFMRPVFPDVAY